MSTFENIEGKSFGQLTVLSELPPHITPNGSKQRIVRVKCICGKEFTNPQAFNGHKSHCEIHLKNKYSSLDEFINKKEIINRNNVFKIMKEMIKE